MTPWLGLVLAAAPVAAAGNERIQSYDVVLRVRASGALQVTETIDYDFGSNRRHGIFRDVLTRVPYDNDRDRLYTLHDVSVTSPTPGTPTGVSRSEDAGVTSLRIGDPDRLVTGRHTYVLRYTVDGALNAFTDHVELFWNVIGDQWDVPIRAGSAFVETPGAVQQVTCFAGPKGSRLPCGSATAVGTRATFSQAKGLPPFNALTVVVGLRAGDVAAAGPVLEERWSLRRSLTPTPLTAAVALLVLGLGVGGVAWLVGSAGRDRRFVGRTPGVLPATGEPVIEGRMPLVDHEPVAVAFAPPKGLRPGQIGTLLDEQANVLDVTATIVDLAVRGHLRIEEQARAHWFSRHDWVLVRLDAATDDVLLPYEKALYDGLFESGPTVALSQLTKHFAARLAGVQTKLYEDVTAAGWFRGRPDKVRGRWSAAGIVLAIAGGWLTWILGQHLHWAVVGAAITVVGLFLHRMGRRMPARTAKGSAVLAQANGFRQYIHTAEAEQLRFEEGQDIFSRYLPYAIVFGEVDRWVRVFGALAVASPAGASRTGPSWYVGPTGWDADHFSDSLTGFTSSAASTIAAATPSSSGGSGFGGGGSSGGGGGGGGGGSW
jgi:uncharacterized membrane protein YgcG